MLYSCRCHHLVKDTHLSGESISIHNLRTIHDIEQTTKRGCKTTSYCVYTSNKDCHFPRKNGFSPKRCLLLLWASVAKVTFLISSSRVLQKIVEMVDGFVDFSQQQQQQQQPQKLSIISRLWQKIMNIFKDFARTPSSEKPIFFVPSFVFSCSFLFLCFSSFFSDAENGKNLREVPSCKQRRFSFEKMRFLGPSGHGVGGGKGV